MHEPAIEVAKAPWYQHPTEARTFFAPDVEPSVESRPQVILLWVMAQIRIEFSDENSMERSTMYQMTRSDKDARRMVLIPLIGMMAGPLIWFIPSMAGIIMHPNLAAEYPQLQ